MKRFLTLILLFFVATSFTITNKNVFASTKTDTNSAEIVMEINTNRVLHQKNADIKMYMASTTKILTAICAIENIDLNKQIVVKKETTGIEGSSIYLECGEKLSIKHLLYGLMLRSGNDCAQTIAESYSGKISDFIDLMNKTAKKIGANNSNFVNAHGLHDDNHYTTAYDLALISCYAMKNDSFREIVSTKKIEIPYTTKNSKRVLINKNKMLKNFDGATGIKTGYTKKAGRCLVSSAKRNDLELISVVLNCPSMWQKSSDLLNYAFNQYKNYKVLESDEIIDFYNDKKGKKVGIYTKNDIVIPLTKEEKDRISYKVEYNFDIGKYIKKDSVIGKIKFYIENNLIFCEEIYNIIDINN